MNSIDARRLQELIELHGRALKLYARQWCQSPEDVVQEALIDLLRQQPVPDNLVGWLYVAVRRRAINVARGETRRATRQQHAAEQQPKWFEPIDNALDEAIECEQLLANLPILEREILVAKLWGEQTFAEIATLVNQPLSTVHRKYHQALQTMRTQLNRKTLETNR